MVEYGVLAKRNMQLILLNTGEESDYEDIKTAVIGPSQWDLNINNIDRNSKRLVIRGRSKAPSMRGVLITVEAWIGKEEDEEIKWVKVKDSEQFKRRYVKPEDIFYRFDVSARKYWKKNRLTKFKVTIEINLADKGEDAEHGLEQFDWFIMELDSQQLVLPLNILKNPRFLDDENVLDAIHFSRRLGFREVFHRCIEYLEARQEHNPAFAAALRRLPRPVPEEGQNPPPHVPEVAPV